MPPPPLPLELLDPVDELEELEELAMLPLVLEVLEAVEPPAAAELVVPVPPLPPVPLVVDEPQWRAPIAHVQTRRHRQAMGASRMGQCEQEAAAEERRSFANRG